MPFDGATYWRSLASRLADVSFTPVPESVLTKHKFEQVQKHGPSFWYRHQAQLPAALLVSVAGMAVSGGMVQQFVGQPWSDILTFGWLCVIGLLVSVSISKVRGYSSWKERSIVVADLVTLGAPERITNIARTALRAVPNGTLILGELTQEEVVLDPYLLLERDGAVVCLGIWEGDHIYECAAKI